MNKVNLFVLSIFFLSACSGSNDTNMKNFIIGRWKGEFLQETGDTTSLITYNVEFLPFNILLVDISRPDESVHGIRFSYKFVTDDRIRIGGRIDNEIQVKNDHNNLLIIESDHGLPPNGRYERVFSRLEWLFIFVIVLLVGIFLAIYLRINKRKSTSIYQASQ